VRISPDAVREAELRFAAPLSGGPRKRPPDHGIPEEIVELLDRQG
jgi:hypothetical protein